jgi:uroporphyrinogen decarboxylase
MTMRETVLAAIAHQQTELPPINIETTMGFDQYLRALTGETNVSKTLHNHMLRVKYKHNIVTPMGMQDLFGVRWIDSPDGGDVGMVSFYPMEDKDADYVFPRVNKELANRVLTALANEKERYTMFSITMGFFERAWSLRGMENILMDMCCNEELAKRVFNGVLEHHHALLSYILDKPFDAVYFGDDWGQQRGLIMGPPHWRKYIKPGVSELFHRIKQAGKQIVLHSCGDLRDIMGELVDMGVDVYNTVQPEIYDLQELKREYGKDLTFYGGISTQQFLPFAKPDQVKEMTKRVLDILFQDGGYILSPTHVVTPDIPPKNVLALRNVGLSWKGNGAK